MRFSGNPVGKRIGTRSKKHENHTNILSADGAGFLIVARSKRPVCRSEVSCVSTRPVQKPVDILFPIEARSWSECTKERYIERLCIWSDGSQISEQMYRDARQAAWQDESDLLDK